MKTRGKIIISLILCAALCSVSFTVTYSYLISQDSSVNTFIVGENTVEITEEYEPPKKLSPGIEFKKSPSVKNTGNLPCFVRVRADFSDSRAEEFCEPLDIDTQNWEYNESSGYYLYKNILNVGETTAPLFTTVKLKTEKLDGTAYTENDMIDFDILVYAESVQQGEYTPDEYSTVWSRYEQ